MRDSVRLCVENCEFESEIFFLFCVGEYVRVTSNHLSSCQVWLEHFLIHITGLQTDCCTCPYHWSRE